MGAHETLAFEVGRTQQSPSARLFDVNTTRQRYEHTRGLSNRVECVGNTGITSTHRVKLSLLLMFST